MFGQTREYRVVGIPGVGYLPHERFAEADEVRLAYVAVTRATRRLVLAFDPAQPSPFLAEMGYRPTSGATTER